MFDCTMSAPDLNPLGGVAESKARGCEVFSVEGPDLIKDRLIDLHVSASRALVQRFGVKPGRSSLHRWRVNGYPVDRNGPRVILPTATRLKRVYTSYEALSRWFRVIQHLGDEIRRAGGVAAWRDRRAERKTP